jgi:hypothetical protein
MRQTLTALLPLLLLTGATAKLLSRESRMSSGPRSTDCAVRLSKGHSRR